MILKKMTMKEILNQCYNNIENGEFRCKISDCIVYVNLPRDYMFCMNHGRITL